MSAADLGTWERVLLPRQDQDGHLRSNGHLEFGKANLATLRYFFSAPPPCLHDGCVKLASGIL
jgi:hypothetical protein